VSLQGQKAGGGQAEVSDLDLIVGVQEDVYRLQIPVNDSLLMNVRKALSDFPK